MATLLPSQIHGVLPSLRVLRALLIFSASTLGLTTSATTLYVALNGDDSGPGSSGQPLNSLREAFQRSERSAEITEIVLAEGFYRLEKPVVVNRLRRDPAAPLKVRAARGAEVILSSGQLFQASDWAPLTKDDPLRDRLPEAARDHVRVLDLAAAGIKDFGKRVLHGFNHRRTAPGEVFLGLERAPIAAWPNRDEAADRTEDGHFIEAGHWAYGELADGSITIPDEKAALWEGSKDLWAHGYWGTDWADYHRPVEIVDGTLQPGGKPQFGTKKNGAFRVYNLPEELDQPGEWYLDPKQQKLYFWPRFPADLEAVVFSLLEEPLLHLRTTENIRFEGLTFAHGRAALVKVDADASHITFTDCTFAASGHAGLFMNGRDHRVENCRFHDIGETAIIVKGGDRQKLQPGNNIITRNRFHDYGQRYYAYSGAARIDGVGHEFSHNHISHAPHMAVQVNGNLNRITRNHIHDICRYSDDAGAIYSGREFAGWGNRIEENLIHDIRTRRGERHWVHAIYLDDFASGYTVRRNIFLRIDAYGTNLGGGRHNRVEDNYFAHMRGAHLNDNRGLKWINQERGSSWNKLEKLAEVRHRREPWRSAFPGLAEVPEDFEEAKAYFLPTGCTFTGNAGTDYGNWTRFVDWSPNDQAGVEEHYTAWHAEPIPLATDFPLADWTPNQPRQDIRLENGTLLPLTQMGPEGE